MLTIKTLCRTMIIATLVWLTAGFLEATDQLTELQKQEAVLAIAGAYQTHYVYPVMADRMSAALLGNLTSGAYTPIKTGRDLARQITRELQAICSDRHVVVAYQAERIAREKTLLPHQIAARDQEDSRRRNFGFREVRILDGHVGYLKISSFDGDPQAFETAAGAMSFISSCDAVILDLRFNPGGDPAMVQFLASYFLPVTPILLDQFHYRAKDRIEQLWSLPHVPGKRLDKAELFILIDGFTFSAAEGLAYDLQVLKRATIMGEPSVGGAHITETRTVLDSYLLYIPVAYSCNPVTRTNFQGQGVQPDFPASGASAIDTVLLKVLEKLLQKTTDEQLRTDLEGSRKEIRERMTQAAVTPRDR
jgi:retinol-binding protein 3